MPTFSVPALSASKLYDGSALKPNQTVVPVMLVVDANGKIASYKGEPIMLEDVVDPTITWNNNEVTQETTGYGLYPSTLSVSDDSVTAPPDTGNMVVYHIVSKTVLDLVDLQGIINDTTLTDYAEVSINYTTANSEEPVTTENLKTSKAYNGAGFDEITEGDEVRSYVVVKDPNGNFSMDQKYAWTVADHTPPVIPSLTLSATQDETVTVTGLNGVTDYGSGVASVSLFYNTTNDAGGSTGYTYNPIAPQFTSSYNMSGLNSATNYFVWASAVDKQGNETAKTSVGNITTLDSTDPVISGTFDVSQGASDYTFTVNAGTITDNVDGPLKVYFIMASSDLDKATLAGIDKGLMELSSKDENVSYTGSNNLGITSLALSTTKYWTGSEFASITETAPASLRGHIYVLDAAANENSAQNTGSAKTVVDVTPPAFGGTVSAVAAGSDSITVSWGAAFADGRGINEAKVYYSTNDPAGDLAGWKLDPATYVTDAGDISSGELAAGSKDITGLDAETTYHVYLCVKDDEGNELEVDAGSATTEAAAAAGLYPRFAFNNNYDHSTGNMTATVQGDAGTIDFSTLSKYGSHSLKFDSTSGTAKSLGIPLSQPTSTWTVGLWVYQFIDSGFDYHTLLEMVYGSGANDSIAVTISTRNSNVLILYTGGSSFYMGPQPPNRTWSFLALTCDGSAVSVYVDGVSRGTRTVTTSQATISKINLSATGKTQHVWGFRGHVDELYILDYALEPHEIQTLMQDPENSDTQEAPPTVAFDSASLTAVTDSYTTGAGVSRSFPAVQYPSGTYVTVSDVYSTSPLPASGDFTYMVPIRITKQSFENGDRLAVYFNGSSFPVSQIRYNDGSDLLIYGVGASQNTPLPDHATGWYNEYHLLTGVYHSSTSTLDTYLHYTLDGGATVESISALGVPAGSPSGVVQFNWQGGASPSVVLREASAFDRALTAAEVDAYAPPILIPTPAVSTLSTFDTSSYTNDYSGVSQFFTDNLEGYAKYNNPSSLVWNASKGLYHIDDTNEGHQMFVLGASQTFPYTASMEFEIEDLASFGVVQVSIAGDTDATHSAKDLTAVNTIFNYDNYVGERLEVHSPGTQRWLYAQNAVLSAGYKSGPKAYLENNTRYRMSVTINSLSSVEITTTKVSDGSIVTGGQYTNAAMSTAFASGLYWKAYFQAQGRNVLFGNFVYGEPASPSPTQIVTNIAGYTVGSSETALTGATFTNYSSYTPNWFMQYAFKAPTWVYGGGNEWHSPSDETTPTYGLVTLSVSQMYTHVVIYASANPTTSANRHPTTVQITNGDGGSDILSLTDTPYTEYQETTINGNTMRYIMLEFDNPVSTTTYYFLVTGNNVAVHHIQLVAQ